MLTLFYKPSCPFCHRVIDEIDALGVSLSLKDVSSDASLLEELISIGGKKQVPFLVDTEKGVQMYESADILTHIKDNYVSESEPKGKFAHLNIHKSDDSCDTCE